MNHNQQKRVAVINDFCGFGRCSLAVSMPILAAMGLPCCPLPTAIFSNHTGFEQFYSVDFTPHMERYMQMWEKLQLQFAGILTGFLGSPDQIDLVESFFRRFRTPGTVTVVDPVMGDYGRLYPSYSPRLAERMRRLLPYAEVLTPNLTEACLLTGTPYDPGMGDAALQTLCERLREQGPQKIVITGLERGDDLENFVYEAGHPPVTVRAARVGPCRSGTGDVFSSIITADAVLGRPLADSVRHAAGFVAKVLRRAVELQLPLTDGLCFEEFLLEIQEESEP